MACRPATPAPMTSTLTGGMVPAGVLIMGLLRNGLNINNVSAFWQQILIGLVIIIAVYIDVLRRRAAVRT